MHRDSIVEFPLAYLLRRSQCQGPQSDEGLVSETLKSDFRSPVGWWQESMVARY